MRWEEIISEAFQERPVSWFDAGWGQQGFKFEVDDQGFHGYFSNPEDDGNWELNFVADGEDRFASTANTGGMGSKSIKVFSHVIQAIKDFIGGEAPETISFDGDEKLGKAQLYMSMARHLKPQLASMGYRTAVEGDGSVATFTIEKMPDQ
jgi:hypothetical protein